MFKAYTVKEIKIFKILKEYFETLPPLGSDDYANAFYDLVAQFGAGGEEYMDARTLFSDLIEVQIEFAYEKLSEDDKDEIMELYESNFMDDQYYDSQSDEYSYDVSYLSILIADRFKAWVYDTFDQEYHYDKCDDEIEDNNIDEYDEEVIPAPETINTDDDSVIKSVKSLKNKTRLEHAFKLFEGRDELRPFMLKPFKSNDCIVASNGHILIRIKKEQCDFEFDTSNIGPNITSIVPQFNRNNLLQLEKEFFEKYRTLDKYAQVIKDIKCPICSGERVVEWSFESYKKFSACPLCHGKGFLQEEVTEKTGEKEFDFQLIQLENLYFGIDNFYTIFEVQSLIGGDIVLVALENSRVVFKIGDCDVLIMSRVYSEKDDYEVIDITDKFI